MVYYILIGVVFTLLNYRYAFAALESHWIKWLNKILDKIGLGFLKILVPIVAAIDLVMLWPIFLIDRIYWYIACKIFKRRMTQKMIEDMKRLDDLFETLDHITDM